MYFACRRYKKPVLEHNVQKDFVHLFCLVCVVSGHVPLSLCPKTHLLPFLCHLLVKHL